ncbi:signal peptidase II [Subsaximicrobium wynnwilliamsii]|uniref:Lipoprotein signal peptidase n=1 Tax=Subsaximicrobium wynnwilliamsii TaxID=291179 RepID=A0A5C6ZNH3_9FLAO|nr:signal peptidase II [Subsaximicrobium wynnwilliamsii]TXD85511.1 signal peptidase II [Subsaximicrobium wynnwilliamsii]TXD90864.1 signal peptidase II [Subsaximicrobium wynnwilliamsii]TXE05371.1 signal peptidase II [Subsaximicrobium wynnwilliamsii]
MKLSRTLRIVLLIVFNIAIDQISKFMVRASIDPGERIKVVGDTFLMMNVENEGAFLGMGSDMNPTLKLLFLLILPIAVLSYLLYYILSNKALDKVSVFALSCIAGGGIANIYDRIVYGSVTDFFYLDFGGVFHTGIFNVADMSVTFGMIVLFYSSFFLNKNASKA